MRKIRVLLLLHELTRTGAPKIVLEMFDTLRESTEVRVVTIRGGPLMAEAESLGPLWILSDDWNLRGWRRHYYYRSEFRARMRAIRRWSPDLIYVNSIAALPIARSIDLPPAPVILHVHELKSMTEMYMAEHPDLLTRWPTRYIAVSEAVVRDLEETCGIGRDRVALIHSFVQERKFARVDRRGSDGHFVVGGCGDPSWRKGVELWLFMAIELRELLGPSTRFVWLGAPDRPGDSFRIQARLMGLGDVVEFVPSTPNPRGYFERFDAFAMTSWEDPCPAVVMENMLLETPVACFAGGGGAAEVVGPAGIVVDRFCPREMARRIAELASNPDERARLGGLGAERVRAHFTDRVQIPKVLREIENVARVATERKDGVA